MNASRVKYAADAIDSCCVLAGTANETELATVVGIVIRMLQKVWEAEYKSYVGDHTFLQAREFWSSVCNATTHTYDIIATTYPEDPKTVMITIQPKKLVSNIILWV
jgi:hypothetical protein